MISHAIIASAFHPVATADHGNTPTIRTHSLDHSPNEFTLVEAIHTHHGTPVLGPNAAHVCRSCQFTWCIKRMPQTQPNVGSVIGSVKSVLFSWAESPESSRTDEMGSWAPSREEFALGHVRPFSEIKQRTTDFEVNTAITTPPMTDPTFGRFRGIV